MKKGLVIKSTGSWYSVKTNSGGVHQCRIKGKFRTEGIRSTNPVAVGDYVEFEVQKDANVITHICERKNYIIRKAPKLSKKSQVIAANIDQAFLIVTVNYPVTTTIFIDRFLASAEAYRIPARLIFNKIDRYREKDMERLGQMNAIYKGIGYPCYEISAKKELNLDVLKDVFKNRVNVLAGHSGVGKSTLINAIEPDLNLKTAEISDAHLSGKHITTFSEMFELSRGGYIIDTPGIRGFGTVDMEKEEIFHFFPEMFRASEKCRYYNCTHLHEPGCAVKQAIEEGKISHIRYESYLNMMQEDADEKYRV